MVRLSHQTEWYAYRIRNDAEYMKHLGTHLESVASLLDDITMIPAGADNAECVVDTARPHGDNVLMIH